MHDNMMYTRVTTIILTLHEHIMKATTFLIIVLHPLNMVTTQCSIQDIVHNVITTVRHLYIT